jgi:hypothetical protein
MKKLRYLTKSRFKQALECPTKLYYDQHSPEVYHRRETNAFAQALAEGGFQIGEMAKYKYCFDPTSSKITIDDLNETSACKETKRRLTSSQDIVIAEGAVKFKSFFIRADLLVKTGKTLKLIEVKSKAISEVDSFLNRKNLPSTKWESTLYDLAFQTYVVQNAYPNFDVVPYLLLVDRDSSVDQSGISQWFTVLPDRVGSSGNRIVSKEGLTALDFKESLNILREFPLKEVIDRLIWDVPVPTKGIPEDQLSFVKFLEWCAHLINNSGTESERFWMKPAMGCKTCAYQNSSAEKGQIVSKTLINGKLEQIDPLIEASPPSAPSKKEKKDPDSKNNGIEKDPSLRCGLSECWSHHKWDNNIRPTYSDILLQKERYNLLFHLWQGR